MPLADACIIGPIADGVILIAQAGRTQRDVIKQAEHRLHQSRANTLGCVVTNVEFHLPHYMYRYLQKYDSYYEYNDKAVAK